MKQRTLNEISKNVEGLRYVSTFKKYPVFVLDNDKSEILKGFSIYETPKTIDVALWFCPNVRIDDGFNVFLDFNNIFTNGHGLTKHKECLISKGSTDHLIVGSVCGAIQSKLKIVNNVDDYTDFIDVLDKEFGTWLLSAFSQCQYAMLLFHQKKYEEAIYMLKNSIPKMNQYNPIFKIVTNFINIAEQDNELGYSLINSWRKNNAEKYKEIGFI